MRQKKNCNGCKALSHVSGTTTGMMQCDLGYGTKCGQQLYGITVSTIPTEPCPKPLTNSDYIYQRQMHTKTK